MSGAVRSGCVVVEAMQTADKYLRVLIFALLMKQLDFELYTKHLDDGRVRRYSRRLRSQYNRLLHRGLGSQVAREVRVSVFRFVNTRSRRRRILQKSHAV